MSSNSSASSSPPRFGGGGQPIRLQNNTYYRPNPPFRPPTRSRRQNVDYGIRNSLAQLGTRELHGLDVYRWEDDDLSLRSAAAQARLPYDRMTKKELELFPEMSRAQASVALFLYIRNRTLVLWQLDPLVELTVDYILTELPQPFDSDGELVSGIHAYLQRYGFINFGIFHRLTTRRLDCKKTVIVIGAGPAGLVAARQLKFFGFSVILLEGRARPGGRVQTIQRKNMPAADLGAMIVMGIVGNPLVTLIQQTPVTVFRANNRCPIYDNQGKLVDSRKDDMIERSFNRILGTISYLSHAKGITEIKLAGEATGRKISLGKAFELILSQQELRVKTKWFIFWQKHYDLLKKLEEEKNKVDILQQYLSDCVRRLRENGIPNPAEATAESIAINFNDPDEHVQRQMVVRSLRKMMELALEQYDAAERERSSIELAVKEFTRLEPSVVYMNNMDKRILDFHLANLEYAIGAPLDKVSMKDWDQDDPYGFAGSHMTIKEGLGSLIGRLRPEDLTVHYGHAVDRIEYGDTGVTVHCEVQKKQQNEGADTAAKIVRECFKADAVLCTVPLGVLKRGDVQFEPELPRWKREAISNMGFGVLNKIIIFFAKPFWDTKRSSFGRLNDTSESRGELFMFFSNDDLPLLVGLFAGKAASITGAVDDKIIMQKAMKSLRNIFGNICPLEPLTYYVTRWHLDKFSLGSYSYMGLNSSPDDYDTLARPLHPNDDASSTAPRVFFAGEHTNRQYPASVHGAFLSGLREAAKIADTFIGPLSADGEVTRTVSISDLNIRGDEPTAESAPGKSGTSGVSRMTGAGHANGSTTAGAPVEAAAKRAKMDERLGSAMRISGTAEVHVGSSSDDDVQIL